MATMSTPTDRDRKLAEQRQRQRRLLAGVSARYIKNYGASGSAVPTPLADDVEIALRDIADEVLHDLLVAQHLEADAATAVRKQLFQALAPVGGAAVTTVLGHVGEPGEALGIGPLEQAGGTKAAQAYWLFVSAALLADVVAEAGAAEAG